MRNFIFLGFFFFLFTFKAFAQCNASYVEDCKKKTNSKSVILGTYNLNFDGVDKVKTYDIGLRKDTRYQFTLCYEKYSSTPILKVLLGGDVVVNSKKGDKHYKAIEFICKETHGYALRVEGTEGCVVVVVSSLK